MGSEQTRVCHLNVLSALDGPGASDLENLSGCGEVHPGGSLDGLDSTPHPPPMTGIDPGGGWDVLPGQGLERLAQSLLVAQRREKVVTTTPGDPLGCVHLCVHGVGGDHYPVHAQRFEQDRQGGDLWLDLSATRAWVRTVPVAWSRAARRCGARGLPQAGCAHGLTCPPR